MLYDVSKHDRHNLELWGGNKCVYHRSFFKYRSLAGHSAGMRGLKEWISKRSRTEIGDIKKGCQDGWRTSPVLG